MNLEYLHKSIPLTVFKCLFHAWNYCKSCLLKSSMLSDVAIWLPSLGNGYWRHEPLLGRHWRHDDFQGDFAVVWRQWRLKSGSWRHTHLPKLALPTGGHKKFGRKWVLQRSHNLNGSVESLILHDSSLGDRITILQSFPFTLIFKDGVGVPVVLR